MAENMNVNGLKYVDEGEHSYTLQNAQGMPILIAKSQLSPDSKKVISKLPKVETKEKATAENKPNVAGVPEGTQIAMNAPAPVVPKAGPSPALQQAMAQQMGAEGVPGYTPAPTIQMQPQAAPSQVTPQPVPQQVQQAQPMPQIAQPIPDLGGYDQALGQMQAGFKAEAAAADQNLKRQQIEQQKAMEQRAEIEKRFATKRTELDTETQKIERDLAESKIDPNRFWSQKTGVKGGLSKVTALVGLFLGGLSQSRTGVNPAAKAIDDMIDNDILSQKADMEKKQNLLRLKMDQYKDLTQAESAAKLDMYNMLNAQIKLVEAGTQSQTVKARAQQAMGELNYKMTQLKTELAMKYADRTQQQAIMTAAMDPNIKPETIGQIARINPELAQQIVPGVGYVLNKTEAPKVAAMKASYDAISKGLTDLRAIRKQTGAEFLDRNQIQRGKSIQGALVLEAKNLFELGVLSAQDVELVEKLIPDPSSIGFVDTKLAYAQDFMKQKVNAFMRGRVANFQGVADSNPKFRPDA